MDNDPIPVTVLTGFLGSGKTTLLNRILSERHGRKLAVIENEFGEVGVDNQLVIQSDEELFEMNNGCICCSVRGDLIRILGRLLKRKDRLDGILIETTGLANPAPVAQTFFTDDEMKRNFRLDGIVTVVDAKHVSAHLDSDDESVKQLAFADAILLNKTDLSTAAELDALEARIRGINAVASISRTRNCDVPLDRVLDIGGFNLVRATEIDPKFLEPEYPFEWAGAYALPAGSHQLVIGLADGEEHDHDHGEGHHHHHHGAENELDVAVMPLASTGEADTTAARDAAVGVFSDWERRVKAGESIEPGKVLNRLLLDEGRGTYALDVKNPGLFAVFEGCGEEPLHIHVAGDMVKPAWQADYHGAHEHNEAVSSVGIRQAGELDGRRLNEWIGGLLRTKGNDIYRMKGVLSVKGAAKRLVFQGIHMLFDAKFDRDWGSEPRVNTLVFIGKNLDRSELTDAFKACLAAEQRMQLTKHWAAQLDDYVIDLGWSPDGTLLAAASGAGPISVFAADDGAKRHEFAGHEGGSNALAWRPASSVLASGGQDGAVKLWDAQAGQHVATAPLGRSWVEHIAWRPGSGTPLLAAGAGRKFAYLNPDASLRHEFKDAPKTISAISWHPQGGCAAVAFFGGVCLWDADDALAQKEYAYGNGIHALAWSPDGRWLVSGNQDPSVHLWMPESDVELQMSGYETKVRHLSFDSASRWLATSGSADACVWDCTGQGPEGREPVMLPHPAHVCGTAFQRTHGLLATASEDGTVMLWSPDRKQPMRATVKMPVQATGLAWSPDDKLLAIGSEKGIVYVLRCEP